ncbi:MAG: hypothetical protein ACI4T9_09575 [Prevotella sp.]
MLSLFPLVTLLSLVAIDVCAVYWLSKHRDKANFVSQLISDSTTQKGHRLQMFICLVAMVGFLVVDMITCLTGTGLIAQRFDWEEEQVHLFLTGYVLMRVAGAFLFVFLSGRFRLYSLLRMSMAACILPLIVLAWIRMGEKTTLTLIYLLSLLYSCQLPDIYLLVKDRLPQFISYPLAVLVAILAMALLLCMVIPATYYSDQSGVVYLIESLFFIIFLVL